MGMAFGFVFAQLARELLGPLWGQHDVRCHPAQKSAYELLLMSLDQAQFTREMNTEIYRRYETQQERFVLDWAMPKTVMEFYFGDVLFLRLSGLAIPSQWVMNETNVAAIAKPNGASGSN